MGEEWGLPEGWDTGGREKVWAVWGIEEWEAGVGVVKENIATGSRTGSRRQKGKL